MRSLKGKTLFITGASRGIGREIALRAARDGANIVIAAKTTEPHPKLPGTIYTVAKEVEAAGGRALALAVDVREEASVKAAVDEAAKVFGAIDILVNNASAISLTTTLGTPMKRYDLMHGINVRGSFLCMQACAPLLEKSDNPHLLELSPPLSLDPKWYGPHVAYTLSKMNMSLLVLGWAEEFRAQGIACNALWPRTLVATAAVQNLLGGDGMIAHSRVPAIVSDAAHAILTRPSRECTGNFFIDEDVLRAEGVTDFSKYSVDPNVEPLQDLFLG
jgi:citronellol/citronellal dehydrogenase